MREIIRNYTNNQIFPIKIDIDCQPRFRAEECPKMRNRDTCLTTNVIKPVTYLPSSHMIRSFLYNHLSNPDGSLAAYEEIESLDSCGGHSDPSKQYHYHLVMCCIPRVYFEKNGNTQCRDSIIHRRGETKNKSVSDDVYSRHRTFLNIFQM